MKTHEYYFVAAEHELGDATLERVETGQKPGRIQAMFHGPIRSWPVVFQDEKSPSDEGLPSALATMEILLNLDFLTGEDGNNISYLFEQLFRLGFRAGLEEGKKASK